MKTRTLTAAVMAAVMIPILVWGDRLVVLGNPIFLFDLFLLAVSVLAAVEFRRMMKTERRLPVWIDVLTIVFTASAYAAFVTVFTYPALLWVAPAFAMAVMLVYGVILVMVDAFKSQDFANAMATILYCSIGFAAMAILRGHGLKVILYALLVAMMNDTFAMWVGMKWGKHRLCPNVSPKKSVEGAIGGLVIGSAIVIGYVFAFDVFPGLWWGWIVLMTLVFSCLGQIGDLVASKFKRSYAIKDYGNLFPGHGGVLDRFDSWMYTCLAVLFAVEFLHIL